MRDIEERHSRCFGGANMRLRSGWIHALALAVALSSIGASGVAVAPTAAGVDPVIAGGVLVDATGRPTSGLVELHLSPSDPTATTEPVLANAYAASNGSFEFRLSAIPLLTSSADRNGGWVNLFIVASDGTWTGERAFSRKPQLSGWQSREADAQVRIVLDQPSRAAGAMRSATVRPNVIGCMYGISSETNADTVVGELHTYYDQSGTFTYGQTADSDIGVGVSQNGTNWSLSGSLHVGNNVGSSVSKSAGAYWGYTQKSNFHYHKLFGNAFCPYLYKVEAQSWNTGMTDGTNISSLDGVCAAQHGAYRVIYGANTTFDRQTNSLYNFSGAVTVFGASLTAKSGASSYVKIHFNFGSATSSHPVCGDNASPGSSTRVFSGG
jgi:hypothetical protein